MDTQEYFSLQEEFFTLARKNLCPDSEEAFADVVDEARYHVSDWYAGESYYVKPEDILVDYFFLSPTEAHKYLVLFRETK